MKNFEKYIDELLSAYKNSALACGVRIVRKGSMKCEGVTCEECCAESKQWLLEEYKEPIKLSHDEYVILKNVDKKYHSFVYGQDGTILFMGEKPKVKSNYIFIFEHLFTSIEKGTVYEIAKLITDYEKEH